MGFIPTPLERAGTVPSRAGPYFFEEIGERTPRGRRFLPLGTPFSGGRNRGRWLGRYGPGLRPPRPTPHGPPTSSGGREKWFIDGRKNGNPNGYSLPSPKGYLPTSPARPAGGRAVTGLSLRGPQARYQERSTASPHTTPPEKGVPGEEPPPPGVLSPISSQEMGPRPGRPRFPAVPTAWAKPTTPPP